MTQNVAGISEFYVIKMHVSVWVSERVPRCPGVPVCVLKRVRSSCDESLWLTYYNLWHPSTRRYHLCAIPPASPIKFFDLQQFAINL